MPSIFTLQGPGLANTPGAPSLGQNASVLVLDGSNYNFGAFGQDLGYDFYLQPEFDATDVCNIGLPDGSSAPVPCDLQPGPRPASSKEKSQWNIALPLASAQVGVYAGQGPGAYAAVKSGKLDFKRYRDAANVLVGKFYDGNTLVIKPIGGGLLDSSLKWVHDNVCLLVAGGAGGGSGSASVAIKAKAACDALNAMNASSGGGAGTNLNVKPPMSLGKKVAIGAGVTGGLLGLGYAISRFLK